MAAGASGGPAALLTRWAGGAPKPSPAPPPSSLLRSLCSLPSSRSPEPSPAVRPGVSRLPGPISIPQPPPLFFHAARPTLRAVAVTDLCTSCLPSSSPDFRYGARPILPYWSVRLSENEHIVQLLLIIGYDSLTCWIGLHKNKEEFPSFQGATEPRYGPGPGLPSGKSSLWMHYPSTFGTPDVSMSTVTSLCLLNPST
jgi:hypothetical protein